MEINSKKWKYKPFCVQLEFVQGCNRDCSFCGTQGIEKKLYFLEEETLRHSCKLLQEANMDTARILLAGHGEPTLHKDVVKFIKIIREYLPNNKIHLFTNGIKILAHPELIDELFNAGLNGLLFDEYSDHLIEKRLINDLKIDQKYSVVKLQNGVPMFDPTAEKRICIAPPIDLKDIPAHKLSNHCGAGMPPLTEQNHKRCSIIFRDFFIRWDGNIPICCDDFRGEYFVTNIKDCSTFYEAYFHERLESARKFLLNKDRCFHPCNVCNKSPIRPGLLPDMKAKVKLEDITEKDYEIVNKVYPPLSVIRRREYELNE